MEADHETLGDRAQARGWEPAGDGTWVASTPDGAERAVVRAVAAGFEARVMRGQSEPSPAPEPERGPELFQSCDDALDYAEAKLGSGWHDAAE